MTPHPRSARPRLADVRRDAGTVAVTLVVGVQDYVGRQPVGDDPLAAVAAATLQALHAMTPSSVSFRLRALRLLEPAADDLPGVAVVTATVTVAGVAMHEVGAALVRDTAELTVARATLAAMNRRLEVLGT